MKYFRLLIGIYLLLLGTRAFPASKINTFTPAIDTTTSFITETYFETSGTDLILYAVIIGNKALDIIIQRINATASPPILLKTFSKTYAATIAKPSLILLKTQLVLCLSVGLNYSREMIDKASLTVLQSSPESAVLKGVYFSNSDALFYHGSEEGAVSAPESPGGQQIGIFNSGTKFPDQVKYLWTQDKNLLLALYMDLNYILVRATPDLSTIIKDYSSPTSVLLP